MYTFVDATEEVSESFSTMIPTYIGIEFGKWRCLPVTSYDTFEPLARMHHIQEIFNIILRYSEPNLRTSRLYAIQ